MLFKNPKPADQPDGSGFRLPKVGLRMPKVGLRMIKSAVAVFLCFVVFELRGQSGTPFYSAIAAILCMQTDVAGSIKVALTRTLGTVVGGLVGMGVLLMERHVFPAITNYPRYLLLSFCVIVLIYLCVLMKQPASAYISCVVFLSIATSHAADVNVYTFPLMRTIDTLIGIAVSITVNAAFLPHRKKQPMETTDNDKKAIDSSDDLV